MTDKESREPDPDRDDKANDERPGEREPAGPSADATRGGWREDLERLVRRVVAEEELERLSQHLDDVGRVGDLVVAAHLDDALYVERARYHRARREVARAMTAGDKAALAAARERLLGTSASLGVVRLQRDLATGEVRIPLGEGTEPGRRASAD